MPQEVSVNYNLKLIENAQLKLAKINQVLAKTVDKQKGLEKSVQVTEAAFLSSSKTLGKSVEVQYKYVNSLDKTNTASKNAAMAENNLAQSYSEGADSLDEKTRATDQAVNATEKQEKANFSLLSSIKNTVTGFFSFIGSIKEFTLNVVELAERVGNINFFKLGIILKLVAVALRLKGLDGIANVVSKLGNSLIDFGKKVAKLLLPLIAVKQVIENVPSSALDIFIRQLKDLGFNILKFTALTTGIFALDKSFRILVRASDLLNRSVTSLGFKTTFLIDSFSKTALGSTKLGLVLTKVFDTVAGNVLGALISVNNAFVSIAKGAATIEGVLVNLVNSISASFKFSIAAFKDFANAARIFDSVENVITGLLTKITLFGAGFASLGKLILESDSTIAKLSGVTLLALSAALAGAATVMKVFLDTVGQTIFDLGTGLVNAADKAANKMVEYEATQFAFNRTIENFNHEFMGAIGNVESWNKIIEKFNASTSASRKELQQMSTLVVETLGPLGATQKQMEDLISISLDYAKANKKDVVDSLNALTSGLLGNGQAAKNMGVFLDEGTVIFKNFGAEADRSLKTFSRQEQLQLRYNALLKQYTPVAGLAAAATATLAERQKLLEKTQNDLSAEFGKGSEIIENQVNRPLEVLLKLIKSLPAPLIQASGFITSFTGRLLQFVGLMTKSIFTLSLFIATYKSLNALLKTETAFTFFTTNIPFINRSFVQLLSSMGATKIELTSLGGIARTSFNILNNGIQTSIKSMLGLELASKLTFRTLTGAVLAKLATGFKVLANAILLTAKRLLLLLLNPIVAKFLAIAAAIYFLVNAIIDLEKRTKVLSNLWKKFIDLVGGPGIFNKALESIKRFVTVAKRILNILVLLTSLIIAKITLKFVEWYNDSLKLINQLRDKFRGFYNKIVKFAKRAVDTLSRFSLISTAQASELKKIVKPIQESREEWEKNLALQEKLEKLQKQIKNDLKDALDNLFNFNKQQKKAGDGASEVLTPWEKIVALIDKTDFSKIFDLSNIKGAIEKAKALAFGIGAILSEGVNSAITDLKDKIFEFSEDIEGEFNKILNFALSVVNQGEEGARTLANTVVDSFAKAFLGNEVGGVVSQIFSFLNQPSEQFREAVEAFADTIILLPQTLIDNAIILIEAIIDKIPLLIDAWLDAIPLIVSKLASLLTDPQFWYRVGVAAVNSIISLWTFGVIDDFRDIADKFGFATDIFNDTINSIKGPLDDFASTLKSFDPGNFLGSAGGGGGFFGGVGDFFGFANGVDVPDSPRFANDGFGPVMLDRGEAVLTRDTTKMLKAALTQGATGGGTSKEDLMSAFGEVQIVLVANDVEIAKSVNRAVGDGFVIARS